MDDARSRLPPEVRDWISRRADAVRSAFSAYEALSEMGIEGLADETTPIQIFCPFHPNTRTAAARYYPGSGRRHGYVRCFTCKENWDSIALYAKAKGLRFMEGLSDLERRFGIKIPKRPESPDFKEPVAKDGAYTSEAWSDVPRVLELMEAKLLRLRDNIPMMDYVKFCRLLDAVRWDFGKGMPKDPMVLVLARARDMMDKAGDATAP